MAVSDDYGFVVGRTTWENLGRTLLRHRADTTLIRNRRNRSTVRQFLRRLQFASSIDRPVGDLIIVAHANKKAFLKIKMDPRQSRWTTYETLLTLVRNGRVNIHSSLIDRDPGDPPMFFHILGCNIGKARPFISKLKEALGNTVTVTAPKHSHYIWDHTRQGGVFEYLKYTFVSGSPTPLITRNAVVDLFDNDAAHRYKNGGEISRDDWNRWVPTAQSDLDSRAKISTHRMSPELGQSIGGRNRLRGMRVNYARWIKNQNISFRLPADPGSDSARLAALTNHLSTQHRSFIREDFPEWEIQRFASLEDFVAGYRWDCKYRRRRLTCVGQRFEYRIYVPVLDPSNNRLLYNFYPHSGTGYIFNLDLNDTSLYQVV